MIKKKQTYLLKYLLPLFLFVTVWGLLTSNAATTRVECENMTIGGSYASKISSPFSGVALYANNDYCSTNFNFTTATNTISVRGCSNNSSTAQVAVLIGGTQVGTLNFSGTTPSVQTLSSINTGTGTKEIRITVTTDTGAWDAYVDYVEVTDSGSTSSNLITNPGMETGNTNGWTVNGAGTISISTAQKHSGTYSLLHTSRTATWNGPQQNITSKVQNGTVYNCSGWVRLDNAASGSILMTIKKVDGNGTTYTNIASGTAGNSSWLQLSGSYSLSVSGTLNELSIYYEGPDSGINFYIDDVSVVSGSIPTSTPTSTPTPTSTASSGLPVPPGSANVPRPTGAQGNLSVVNWAGFTGAGSYTFDDNAASQIANFSTLMNLNVPMTFYIASNWSGSTNSCWATAVSRGCELGNHSATHPQTAIPSDVDSCTSFLQQHFGVTPLTAASPYGDSSYISVAQSRFLLNRGTNGGIILPNDNTDPYNLKCNLPPQSASASTMANYFSSARSSGGWCILLVHGFLGYNDGMYQPVDISQFSSSVNTVKGYGDIWLDTVLNIGAYWRAQKMFAALTPTQSGSDLIYRWTLPSHFPSGKYLRIKLTGGTPKQNGQVINWNNHGYYEIALDAGSLTVSP